VEDDHVDRPGVEVQQCMELTGPNRSNGLIVLIANAHSLAFVVGRPPAMFGRMEVN
jgi:hypothetical protein